MFDPFVQSDPPILVHELDGLDFQAAWNRAQTESQSLACPMCAQRGVAQRGTSPNTERHWIQFVCGDVVAQEVTAG